MDWTIAIFNLIELQTFTSFWYWLVVIVTWSIAGNWLIGVPFDMLFRARKCAPQELADLEATVARQREYAESRVREASSAAEENTRKAAVREAELTAAISRLKRQLAEAKGTPDRATGE